MAKRKKTDNSSPGAGVDASGNPVLDPTANVLGLVEAANKRTDDLALLRDKLLDEKERRLSELEIKDAAHAEAMGNLREKYAKELGDKVAGHRDQLYEGLMKQITELTARIGPLEKASYENTASKSGVASAWGALLGGAGLIGTLIMIGLFVFTGHPTVAPSAPVAVVPPTQPQIVLVPAQPGTLVQQPPASPTR